MERSQQHKGKTRKKSCASASLGVATYGEAAQTENRTVFCSW